jgi:2-amino-4-hydroxy-6-hydroxymethyldihydropteridine diphosphokinase
MARVYLSLGSNVGDRLAQLRAAIAALRRLRDVRFMEASAVYEAEPWESEPGQPLNRSMWYLNCAVEIETTLPPDALLAELQRVERALGREPRTGTPEAERFRPRTLDIDILFYENRVISISDTLHVPHLLLHERAFVLRPLADLAPELEHPVLYKRVRELLAEVEDPHEVRPAAYSRRWFDAAPGDR